MSQLKFDKEKYDEIISAIEDEVTSFTETTNNDVSSESTSSTLDSMSSMYGELEQNMSGYILSLESLIDSLKQAGDTISSMDDNSAKVMNV